MDIPFFSVIIPVFNREATIRRSIDSVLLQNYHPFELIIVNDGSTDDTKKVIMSYSDRRIQYVESKNLGVSHARNLGISLARGTHCAFLDSDDQWLPHKLLEDSQFITSNPDITLHQSDEFWVRKGKRVNKKKIHRKSSGDIFFQSLEMCMISPSSVVIRKEIFNSVGLFDEKMAVCEDYDLWLRISHSYSVGLIDKPLIIKYGGHSDQLSHSVQAIDRFRIYSLIKLLHNANLPEEKLLRVKDILVRKCGIVKNGAAKRGNLILQTKIEALILHIESGIEPQELIFLLEV